MENTIQFINNHLVEVLIVNASIFIIMFLTSRIIFSRTRLAGEGITDEYIELIRKQKFWWTFFGILTLIVAQILISVVVFLLGYEMDMKFYLQKIFMSSIVLLYLTMMIAEPLYRKFAREFKELALKTKSDVVYDFQFKGLKLIFNWRLELLTTLFILHLNIRFGFHDSVLYIYALIPWVLIAILKKTKFQVLPTMRFHYLQLARVLGLLQAVKCFLIMTVLFENKAFILETSYFVEIILIGVLLLAAGATFLQIVLNYSRLRKMFLEFNNESTGSLSAS